MSLQSDTLPTKLDGRLRRALRRDERVVWTGRPIPGLRARRTRSVCLIGLMILAAGAFWSLGAAEVGWPSVYRGPAPRPIDHYAPFVGVPFMVLGAALLLAPLHAAWLATRTAYALTDRRVLVLTTNDLGARSARSFKPEKMRPIVVDERPDGSGDLLFGASTHSGAGAPGRINAAPSRPRRGARGLLDVADVAALERLVRATLDLDAPG